MKCKFEEKTYEQYHNIELLGKSNIFLPPGQKQEHLLGFDSAMFSKNKNFWKLWKSVPLWKKLFCHPSLLIPEGVYLYDSFWEKIKETVDEINGLNFKFNIFIQYKRPEYLRSNRAKEYIHFGCPYYRYDIYVHQQQILKKIEEHINDKAIVVYAAPAFHTFKELFNYFEKRQLVENSNYIKPSVLDNHQRWTYTRSNTSGYAFSKRETKESIKLMDYIKILKDKIKNYKKEKNSEFINETSYILVESIKKTEYLANVFNRIIEQIVLPQHSFGKTIIKLYICLYLTNLRWAIYYE